MTRQRAQGWGVGALFVLLGAVVAVAVHHLAPVRDVLVIDGGQIARVLTWERDVLGRPLTVEERASTVRRIRDEEILLAEARRRGHLERGYVRGRLVKKMRFLLAEDLQVPSDAEMRAIYDADPGQFRRPGSLAFEQVFFRSDSALVPDDPDVFLRRLEAGTDLDTMGDIHPLGQRVGLRTGAELTRRLGADATERLFDAPLGNWVGPILSNDGLHYARVKTRSDPAQVPFEEILPRLRGSWTMRRQREAITRRTAELVRSYAVRIEGEGPD